MLNKLLSKAWEQYAAALEQGEILELEPHYEEWVGRALDEAIPLPADDPAAA